MKQESDHSPLLWSVVIAIFGLAAIAFFIIAGNAKKQEISFSCSSDIHVDTRHPGYKKGTPWNNADYQLQLRTPFIVSTRETQK